MFKLNPRIVITMTFVAFGAIAGSNVGALPALLKQSSVSPFIFGFMAALGMVSNILMMSLGGFINRRFDHRSVLLAVVPLSYLGLLYTLTVHSVTSFAVSIILFNLALGAMDLFMNAEAAVVEHEARKSIFSSFHGAALYGIAAFGILGSVISIWFGPIWCALAPLPIVVWVIWAVYHVIPHKPIVKSEKDAKPLPMPKKILLLIGIILGLEVACELTCVQWSGQLLADLAPGLAAYSGLGVAFYGFCNGTMRLCGDALRTRYGDFNLMMVSLVVAIMGLTVLATAPSFTISVVAFAATGVGLATIFPCLFSITTRLVPQARVAALAFISGVGGLPRILLPILLGTLAQAYGLHAIFAAAAFVAVLALGFTYWASLEIANNFEARVSPRL
jgi:MFS family permease